jgi:predicted nucleic acid-binding protein
MTTMIDTGVLISALEEAHPLHAWAREQIETCKAEGPVIISDIVFCEFSVAMPNEASATDAVSSLSIEMVRATRGALYHAGQKFKEYREINRGPKLGVLPDFLIGAVANDLGTKLVTTNEKDFVRRFPDLEIVSPPNQHEAQEAPN